MPRLLVLCLGWNRTVVSFPPSEPGQNLVLPKRTCKIMLFFFWCSSEKNGSVQRIMPKPTVDYQPPGLSIAYIIPNKPFGPTQNRYSIAKPIGTGFQRDPPRAPLVFLLSEGDMLEPKPRDLGQAKARVLTHCFPQHSKSQFVSRMIPLLRRHSTPLPH